jgi:hypothetical protein
MAGFCYDGDENSGFITRDRPNVDFEWLALMLLIPDVPVSNLVPRMGCPY